MSGGYLDEDFGLPEYGHAVIIITLKGEITPTKCQEWNRNMRRFKESTMFGDRMLAVTLEGDNTPGKYLAKNVAKKKATKPAAKK
jgi:hypothetical protein